MAAEEHRGRLAGKVALITGAASGQGAAEARLFSAEGAQVVVADVNDVGAKSVADEIGDAAISVHLDVSSEAEWQEAIRVTESTFGGLDVLVNNAGRSGHMKPLEQLALDEYLAIVMVNQVGVFLGMRAAQPLLARGGRSSIINVSSLAGITGFELVTEYSASKHAIRGMSRVAAAEWAKDGIRVNTIYPGYIDTPMTRSSGAQRQEIDGFSSSLLGNLIPLGRLGTAEDIANLALFLASDESSYITAADFVIDGGWSGGLAVPKG